MSGDKPKTGKGARPATGKVRPATRPKPLEVTRVDTGVPDEDDFGGATQVTRTPRFEELLPKADKDDDPHASVHEELTREVMVPEAFWRERDGRVAEAEEGDFDLVTDEEGLPSSIARAARDIPDKPRGKDGLSPFGDGDHDGDTMADVDEAGLADLGDAFPDQESGLHDVLPNFTNLEDPPTAAAGPQDALARAIERETTASKNKPKRPTGPSVWTEPRFLFPGIGLLGGAMIVGLYVWAVTPDHIESSETDSAAAESDSGSDVAKDEARTENATGADANTDAAARSPAAGADAGTDDAADSANDTATQPAQEGEDGAVEEETADSGADGEADKAGTAPTGKKPKAGMGLLSVWSSPKTDVFDGGKKIGSTPLRDFNLKPGKHSIVVKSSKFGLSKAVPITIVAGGVVQKKISFRKGKIAVLVKPWADVMYRGKKLGTTPMPPFVMYEGTYTLKLVNPEHGEKSVKVTVQSGKTAKVIHTF